MSEQSLHEKKDNEEDSRVGPLKARADRQDLPQSSHGATPGPWALRAAGKRGVAVVSVRGVETLPIAYIEFANTDIEDGLANARLIAAAPELLDAALSALLVLSAYGNAPVESACAIKLRAAIAKAEIAQ